MKKNLVLLVSSAIFSLMILVACYEIYGNIEYEKWKSIYDAGGKFGKVTVPSSNKKMMWEYRPYGEYKELRTNRYGFRDDDIEYMPKPPDTVRIIFIGDSITLGLGVEFDRIFTEVMEEKANGPDLPLTVQALNFGIDGYNAVQIGELLSTRVIGFSPDKVIYVMCLNDFDFNESSGGKIRYFAKPGSFLLERINRLRKRISKSDYHRYHFQKNKDAVFDEIIRMNRLLKENGIGFQVVIVPVFLMENEGFDDYPLSGMHEEIVDCLAGADISVTDLLDMIRAEGRPPGYFANDIWHLNEKGHEMMARMLVNPALGEFYGDETSVITGRWPSGQAGHEVRQDE